MNLWEIIRWPFGQFLRLCYELTGSYTIALLLFAVAVKILLLPFGIKQQKNQIRAAKLRPKMLAIEKKYAGRTDQKTLQKKQQEMLELQQSEGYSPMSGCLPMLVQMPVIIILYDVIRQPLIYLCNFSKGVLESVRAAVGFNGSDQYQILKLAKEKLTAPTSDGVITEEIVEKLSSTDLTLFNTLDLSVAPWDLFSGGASWLFIFVPILVFAASFVSMKVSRRFMANPAMDAQSADMQKSNMIMDITMPAMSLYFAFIMPAALGIYWIYQSLLGMLQQFIMSRVMPLPTYTAEEIRAMQKAEKERQAAAIAAAKQRRMQYMLDDDEEDDVNIPVIRSRFDNDEPAERPDPKPRNKKKKK